MKRCVNIDWLEVYCLESLSQPRDPSYFQRMGYEVRLRSYGTPQYSMMFTIWEDGFPLVEVRRAPYSLKSQGGIFEPNACHIRLANRTCYLPSPVSFLRSFLIAHQYVFVSLTRIDIALDFNLFDNGRDPARFVSDFMRERIMKINQSRLAAHGTDSWEGRVWNSLKWGAPTSIVSTKLYNKSLELAQVHDKFYIRDCWQAAGLDVSADVWRVEFSLKAAAQAQFDKQTGEYVPLSLSSYDSRDKLLYRFAVLAAKYFHFKRAVWVRKSSGEQVRQRKDRCPDETTFLFKDFGGESFEPIRVLTKQHEPTRTDKILIKRLQDIAATTDDRKERNAALTLTSFMIQRMRMRQYAGRQAELENKSNIIQLEREQALDMGAVRRRVAEWEDKERRLLEVLMKKYNIRTDVPIDCPF